MERTEQNYRRPGHKLNRRERLAKKFKGVLRCEWCGRWTRIPLKRWYDMYDKDQLFPAKYVHYCSRDKCKAWREEFMPS